MNIYKKLLNYVLEILLIIILLIIAGINWVVGMSLSTFLLSVGGAVIGGLIVSLVSKYKQESLWNRAKDKLGFWLLRSLSKSITIIREAANISHKARINDPKKPKTYNELFSENYKEVKSGIRNLDDDELKKLCNDLKNQRERIRGLLLKYLSFHSSDYDDVETLFKLENHIDTTIKNIEVGRAKLMEDNYSDVIDVFYEKSIESCADLISFSIGSIEKINAKYDIDDFKNLFEEN